MNKGFTLIELLAVIVILAIIALIATPIVINIINDSQKSAATNSAQLYVDGLMKRIVSENMNGEFNPSSCTITNGNISCDGQSLDYTVDGDKPTSGTITFNNGVVTGYTLGISGYTVTKNGSTITTTKGEPGPIEFNGTYVAGGQNDTYIGIAYLDPTDLSTTCTAQLAAQNLNDEETPTPTGIKSGCMKFYVYNDDGTNYSMILDHNTSGYVAWITETDFLASEGAQVDWNNHIRNNKGPVTAMNSLAEDTTGWTGNPRLISADEIAHIVGADTEISWASTDADSKWFWLDGSGNTYSSWQNGDESIANSSNKSIYAWLYDYTYDCNIYGCNLEDNNYYTYGTEIREVYGYWTSSSSASNLQNAWFVDNYGALESYFGVYIDDFAGIRPVITIPKSIFD